jgi:hypothetical protein
MPETFESLLVKLARGRVDYLVAGGVAVCLNGFKATITAASGLFQGTFIHPVSGKKGSR